MERVTVEAGLEQHHVTVLEAVELPADVAHLDSSLADMDGDAFPHGARWTWNGSEAFVSVE